MTALGQRLRRALPPALTLLAGGLAVYALPALQSLRPHGPDALHAAAFTLLAQAVADTPRQRTHSGLLALAGCALLELAQATPWWPGRFDPLDLLAVVIGAGGAMGVTAWRHRAPKAFNA